MWRVRINHVHSEGSSVIHLATREAVDLYLDEPWGTGSTARVGDDWEPWTDDAGNYISEPPEAPEQWPLRTRAVYVESPTGEREELNTPAPVEEILESD